MKSSIFNAIESNSFWDTEDIYTDGKQLIPVFKVYQILNHYIPNWREIQSDNECQSGSTSCDGRV